MSHMPDQPLTRYRAIDGFRFLAALGIVLRHYTRYSENPFWDQLFTKNYLFVDLFFVISGFVITLAYGSSLKTADNYACFLQNRLARVYPLHFVMFLAFLAMDLAAASGLYHAREVHTFNAGEMATNLFLMQAWGFGERLSYNYPSWSISAEWMLYLLFPAVILIMRRGGALALFALGLAGMALLEALDGTGRLGKWTELTWHFGYFRAIPTFLIGAGLFCVVDRSALVFRSFAWPMAFFAGAIGAMALGLPDLIIIALFVLTVAAATGAERSGQRGILTGKVMGHLGDWSYALYMIHAIFGVTFVAMVGPRLLHLHGTVLDVYILACVMLCSALAAPVYRYFEVPARRFFRDNGAGRAEATALADALADGAARQQVSRSA